MPALHHRALADACSVVDSLDAKCREELITWFCHQQLQPYQMLFVDATGLGRTEERYAWILRHLKSYEERYGDVYPPAWGVCYQLCLTFCQTTREQLAECAGLARGGAKDLEVGALVQALELALEAERRLDTALDRLEEREAAAQERGQEDGPAGQAVGRKRFAESRPISGGFEPAMLRLYVQKEVGSFEGLLRRLQKEERWRVEGDDEDGASPGTSAREPDGGEAEQTTFVLESAKALVIAVKESMGRCAVLSRRDVFLDLLRIFKETFRHFGAIMSVKLESQPAARALAEEVAVAEGGAGLESEGAADEMDVDDEAEASIEDRGGSQEAEPAAAAAAAAAGAASAVSRGYSLSSVLLTRGSSTLKAQLGERNADRVTAGLTKTVSYLGSGGKAAQGAVSFYSDKAREAAVRSAGANTAASALVANLATGAMKAEELVAARAAEPTVTGLICTTAEYCSQTLGQLADSYRRKIAPDLAPQVDVEPEQEAFAGVASECIRLMLAHFELLLAAPFGETMPSHSWHRMQASAEHSDYVVEVVQCLVGFAATERRLLPTAHFRYLCDRIVTALASRFLRGIYSCKPLSA